jgi:hypothetical protein
MPLLISLYLTLLLFSPLPSFAAKPSMASGSNPPSGADNCLIIGQPNRSSFSFFNTCSERLYINVCTKDTFGETKLYRSGRTIPVNGRYTIYTFYVVRPENVIWAADPKDALIPPPCKI